MWDGKIWGTRDLQGNKQLINSEKCRSREGQKKLKYVKGTRYSKFRLIVELQFRQKENKNVIAC